MKRADVEEYLNLHGQSKLIDKRMGELKPVLLAELRDGRQSPRDLPFLLERRISNRRISDWKSIAFEYIRKALGSPAKAEQKIADIEEAFPIGEVESLQVVVNREYKV